MLGPSQKYESIYKKNLKEIARMAHYEPIASIPQPSSDFNYTLISKVLDIQGIAIATTMKTQRLLGSHL